jgi:hypothetical protein
MAPGWRRIGAAEHRLEGTSRPRYADWVKIVQIYRDVGSIFVVVRKTKAIRQGQTGDG